MLHANDRHFHTMSGIVMSRLPCVRSIDKVFDLQHLNHASAFVMTYDRHNGEKINI